MKQTSITILILLARALLATNTVTLLGQTYPVFFEDSNLSTNNTYTICRDIETRLSFGREFGDIFTFISSKKDEARPRGGTSSFLPKVMSNGLRLVITNNPVCATNITINKTLSDFYTNKIALVTQYSNVFAAATAFINSINNGSVTNEPIESIRKFIRISPLRPQPIFTDDEFREAIRDWTKTHFYPPSIIDFYVGPFWKDLPDMPYMNITLLFPEMPTFASGMNMIYYENRWSLHGLEFEE